MVWFRWALAAIIALGFGVCVWFMFFDWDKALTGLHSFRQAQNAITASYMLKDGISFFNYQTPVLGKPWEIPFEAPFYQILAVLLVKATSIEVDFAGRLVSIAFWFACLWPLSRLLRLWIDEPLIRWSIVLMLWSCPTYIKWSDSFMMESIALFPALIYLLAMILAARTSSNAWLAVAVGCGVFDGMQKATTFLIVLVPTFGLVAQELFRRRGEGKKLLRTMAGLAVAVIVPMLAIKLWTAHADAVKSLNPLAKNFLTSAALTEWNFGTWQQRFNPNVWDHIAGIEAMWGSGHAQRWVFLYFIPIVLALGIWRGPHRLEIIILALSGFTGVFVFTNLFAIHEYYNYETTLYIQMAVGLALYDAVRSFLEKFRKPDSAPVRRLIHTGICCAVLLFISAEGLIAYYPTIPYSKNSPTSAEMRESCALVAKSGGPQDVLLIYGWDWNPLMPYYSGHRAIMDKESRPLDDPDIKASLDSLNPDEQVCAMVILGPFKTSNDFINSRVIRFHLNPKPVLLPFHPSCYVWVKQK